MMGPGVEAVRRALIVAGGLGTRIRSETQDAIPKALLDLGGRSAIERQLSLLGRHGVHRVVVLAGHLGEALRDPVQRAALAAAIEAEVVIEERPRGTAGGLPLVATMMGDAPFFVLYADMALSLDLERVGRHHLRSGAAATIVAHPNDHPESSDIVVADGDGHLSAIWRRDAARPAWLPNRVPAGVYCFDARLWSLLDSLSAAPSLDFIADVFPAFLARGERVHVYHSCEYLRDTGTPARLARVREDIASGRFAALHRSERRPAIFFDRDGVLTEDREGGVVRAEDLRLYPDGLLAVREVNRAGALAVVVTNQPGVAKGFVSPDELGRIHARLESELGEAGAWLDALYHCPHHPERGHAGELAAYKRACECRKPGTALFARAIEELPIAPAASALIGDGWRDMLAAERAGLWGYGLRRGEGCRESWQRGAPPTLMFDDASEAVHFALHGERKAEPIFEEIAAALRSAARAGRPAVVAVCGRARSGKSLLAHALERSCRARGIRAVRVELDQWIVPLVERNGGSPLEVARVACYPAIYRAAREAGEIVAPGYDPQRRSACSGPRYRFEAADVVLFDGLWAAHESVRSACDHVVFVDQGEGELARRHERYYRWKGFGEEEVVAHWDAVRAREWPLVMPQRDNASHVSHG
jgi:histidinol-phosphate phosphatase family protein